jgi:hypothetical protein
MRLQEEYFRRHNIENIPIIHHCSQGSVLLYGKTSFTARWELVTIRWVEHPHHPGLYTINFFTPNHDAYRNGILFSKLHPSVDLEWDEYEDYFLELAKNLTEMRAVRGHKYIVMTGWEIFVYCYDSWFREQPYDVKELLFASLDVEKPIIERYSTYQKILNNFSTRHPGILKCWKYEVLSQLQNYSDWFARLVEQNGLLPNIR